MLDNPFWHYWYFHLPNYLLAALLYTLLGRFVLGFMVPPDSSNYIWRFFRKLTDPVVAATGFITPRFIGPFLLPLVGMFWLTVLRVGLLIALFAIGLAPQASGTPAP
jgi:YggT family protein